MMWETEANTVNGFLWFVNLEMCNSSLQIDSVVGDCSLELNRLILLVVVWIKGNWEKSPECVCEHGESVSQDVLRMLVWFA